MSGEFVMLTHGTRFDQSMAGKYLREFDAEYGKGRGAASWTEDIAEAMRFPTALAVIRLWRTRSKVNPTRPDGKPNRPLTAHTIEPMRVPEETQA